MISQMMITISRSGQGTFDELGEHSCDLKMNCNLYALQTLQTLRLMDLLHKYVRYRYLLHVRSEKQAHWLCSSGLSHTNCYLYVNYMAVIDTEQMNAAPKTIPVRMATFSWMRHDKKFQTDSLDYGLTTCWKKL